MSEKPSVPSATDEPVIPRLLASNALRANLTKHMDYNKMADHKASALLTVATVIITITLAQFDRMEPGVPEVLLITSIVAIWFSLLTIVPRVYDTGEVDLFHYASFSKLSEDEFLQQFRATIIDKEKLYDAYIRDIYWLGSYRLRHKYRKLMYGKWALLAGLITAGSLSIYHRWIGG